MGHTVSDRGAWEKRKCLCLEGLRESGLLLVLKTGPLDDLLVLRNVGWV